MKVLVLSHLYPRPGDSGQAGFIHRQVKELSARGVEFRLLSPVPWAPPLPGLGGRTGRALAASRATPREWEHDGVGVLAPRYLKLPGPLDMGLFGPLYWRGVRKLVRSLHAQESFDLIHGQMLVPDGYAAAKFGREFGIPSVVTERGYLSVMAGEKPSQRRALRWTLENADQCVFVAEALADLARSIGAPRRRPRVVYTGLDADDFTPGDRASARGELQLPENARIILHLGRNDPRKGVALLLEAFTSLAPDFPDALLCYVGSGSQDEELRRRARELGLAGRVRVAGRRPHQEVPRWLAACDLVAHPSVGEAEGLPNVLVEASACARPIAASRTSGIPEVVADGRTGILVEPGDAGALSAAMRKLLNEPEAARWMGERGREHVLGRFSWKKHADEMLGIYESLVGGARGRGP